MSSIDNKVGSSDKRSSRWSNKKYTIRNIIDMAKPLHRHYDFEVLQSIGIPLLHAIIGLSFVVDIVDVCQAMEAFSALNRPWHHPHHSHTWRPPFTGQHSCQCIYSCLCCWWMCLPPTAIPMQTGWNVDDHTWTLRLHAVVVDSLAHVESA